MDLAGAFSDPDGDQLTYAAESSDTAIVTAVLHPGPVVSLAAPGRGTVTATDPDGLEAVMGIPITVIENPDRTLLTALRDTFVVSTRSQTHPPENWLPDVPLGDWYGINISDAGRVVCLGVCSNEDMNLVSSVPPELADLDSLERLNVGAGSVGPIPPELGSLRNLKVLALGGWITGPVPKEFGGLAALESLYLRGWHLSGPIPSGLRDLPELEHFRIHAYDFEPPGWQTGGETDVCVMSAAVRRLARRNHGMVTGTGTQVLRVGAPRPGGPDARRHRAARRGQEGRA
ncbi:MAG: hypothetical protein OXK74_08900 [Gemmatimonadota bacterium]|nr:hypothetical protein [Gemmatimonadota bacterium]